MYRAGEYGVRVGFMQQRADDESALFLSSWLIGGEWG